MYSKKRNRSEYIPQVLPFIAKYGEEIIVMSPDAEPLQGTPEKPAKELRIEVSTNANAVLAPEFQMP
jgi:hypothetical protein